MNYNIILVVLLFIIILLLLFEISPDVNKQGKTIIWWTHPITRERKFIIL